MSRFDFETLLKEAESFSAESKEQLENFRLRFLSKKGILSELFSKMKDVEPAQRKAFGQQINTLKKKIEERFEEFRYLYDQPVVTSVPADVTLPGEAFLTGSHHPVNLVRKKIIHLFSHIGFNISEGPEIEDDWHIFTSLNFPPEHPARDMQDTFFITSGDNARALRTHTSSIQVRVMETQQPPIRSLMPGRVFRNEAISSRSHCMFHQIEGLYIDKNVSFADLKQTLLYFAREMFGADREIRLRPSYFPFTEPSAEVDVFWGLETETDYRITKGTGWLEIMGCGMVHPNVLKNCGIDPEEYTGYAFGMGLERIALLKYQIDDIRLFFENDLNFLDQFTSPW